jgi:hypothetical protein
MISFRHSKITLSLLPLVFFAFFVATPFLEADTSFDEVINEARQHVRESSSTYRQAIELYLEAKKLPDADKTIVSKELAELYFSHGQYELALSELHNAWRSVHETPDVGRLMVTVLVQSGKYAEALSFGEKLEDTCKDPEFLFYYARAADSLNLYPRALSVYQQIKDEKWLKPAQERISAIERESAKPLTIKNVCSSDAVLAIRNSPDADEHPQAGAIILIDSMTICINEDYTVDYTEYRLIKILNDRGKNKFAELHFDYDSTDEVVTIHFARTITADKKVVPVGEKHIRDVSKYLNFPLYSNARVRIVSLPEVSPGCFVEYRVTWHVMKLVDEKQFSAHFGIQGNEPIEFAYLHIDFPEDYPIRREISIPEYSTYKPQLQQEPLGGTYCEWTLKDIPEVVEEPQMPPIVDIIPHIDVSTFRSWDEIWKWWWPLVSDKWHPDRSIKQTAKKLVKDLKENEEKVAAIYHWVASQIRYVAVEYGEAGFEPHKASEIMKNRYGDCKDQSVLLISMLKSVGIDAYPVLIGTEGMWALNKDFPMLAFNHAIACVPTQDGLLFLDPTAETCSYGDLPGGDQERDVLVFTKDGCSLEKTPVRTAANNRVVKEMKIKIAPDESIAGEREVSTYGNFNLGQRWWLKYSRPVQVREQLEKKVSSVCPGATLDDYKISDFSDLNKPVVLQMFFSGPEFLLKGGRIRLVQRLGGVSCGLVAKQERKYPIWFGVPNRQEKHIEIELPDGVVPEYLPAPISEKTQFLKYEAKYSFENGKLIYHEKQIRRVRIIPVPEYQQYREFLQMLDRRTSEQAVLRWQ